MELLLAATQACPHGLALKRRGTVVFANEAYAHLLADAPVEAVVGKSASALLKMARAATAGRNGNGHAFTPELDSVEFEFSHAGKPVKLEILRDISERRSLERQLRVSQKMEALGRAVGGVAHDFNNLLTAVMLYCDLLRQQLPGGHARRHAEEINLAAQRGAALVRQLLAFARQQVLEPKVLSLNAVVLGMRNMLQRLIGEDIELVVHCAESVRAVKVDPAQIQQVVLNLVVNARDAMPAGGKLVLGTTNVTVDAAMARRQHDLRVGRYVRLTVSDNGCGMSPETLAHAFEPFFTTKEKGKGTGLGLSMVYGIVTQSGGAINLESAPGRGTQVAILLPCAAQGARIRSKPQAAEKTLQPAATRAGRETVLLAEDDPAVCDSVTQLLQEFGYTVLKARSGEEAVRLASGHPGALDLVICDVLLPGLGGQEVVRRVVAQRPDVAVICMSGYGERAQSIGAVEAAAIILQKPFTQAALARAVREALQRRSGKSRKAVQALSASAED